jgi:hypothetical protein
MPCTPENELAMFSKQVWDARQQAALNLKDAAAR